MSIKLENSFFLDLPADRAWRLLNDFAHIAPCVPGAQLLSSDGDQFQGKVKVKLGPIVAEYTGTATIRERDDTARRLLVEGKGKDIRGQGTAGANLVMTVTEEGLGSRVLIETDVSLTGKVAQMGKGVMSDVAARLIDQFVANLNGLAAAAAPTPEPQPASAPALVQAQEKAVEPIDLAKLGASALPVEKILIGGWMVAVLGLLVLILLK